MSLIATLTDGSVLPVVRKGDKNVRVRLPDGSTSLKPIAEIKEIKEAPVAPKAPKEPKPPKAPKAKKAKDAPAAATPAPTVASGADQRVL